MKLTHIMNYAPLGTRAMDHFIVEYDRQAKARGWDVSFGFTAAAPMDVKHFIYEVKNIHIEPCDVLQTSFHSVFEKQVLNLKRSGIAKKLAVIDHSSGAGPRRDWKTPLRRWRGWRAGRIVDAVVCVSHFISDRAVNRVFLPADKIRVVHNGIDLSRFTVGDKRNIDIAYVGQLIPEKGVYELLCAVAGLPDPCKCVIAGDGPFRTTLEHHAQGLPVEFLGHVTDVAGLMAQAKCVVVPSIWDEAFGLVAIEAMACGAAVVVSDAGALPEVVGDCGFVYPRHTYLEHTNILQRLLNDDPERQRMARRGRERVETHFQLHDCVRKHLDIVAGLQ